MKKIVIRFIVLTLIGLFFISPVTVAEDLSQAQGGDRVDTLMGKYNLYPAFEKGGRGLANFFGGWLEVPYNIQTRYSNSDTGGSLFTGIANGLLRAIVRTGVGAYEAVTFFLPYPENFAPIMPTLPYYQKSKRHSPMLWE